MNENSDRPPSTEEDAGLAEANPRAEDPSVATGSEAPPETAPELPAEEPASLEAQVRSLQEQVQVWRSAHTRLKNQTAWQMMVLALLLLATSALALAALASRQNTKARVRSERNWLAAPSKFPGGQARFFSWQQGDPPVRLIKRDEGICFLTGVSGQFRGAGEAVALTIESDGYWYLGGHSQAAGVSAECVVLKY